MTRDVSQLDPADHTEQLVREYFERRSGWSVEKLRTSEGAGQAADFRICHRDRCFLCEVKTIRSVRADIPDGPVHDHYVEVRDSRRAVVDRSLDENPDKTLHTTREEWEWLRISETELRQRYRYTPRYTQSKFEDYFETPLRTYLENSSVNPLPYDMRLDSDDLYVPSKVEMRQFVDWLENEIMAIDRGHRVDRRWYREESAHGSTAYWAHYPLHEATDERDTRHTVSLRLQRRGGAGHDYGLTVHVHSYGTLNVERVRASVEGALGQLRDVAAREKRSGHLPRVVALRFEGGLRPLDHLELLEKEIRRLFDENDDLTAIAVLDWRPAGEGPSPQEGISAWFEFFAETPWVTCFTVYHNSWLGEETEPLDPNAFDDEWSRHVRVGG